MTQTNLDRQKTITVDSNFTVALRVRPISEDEIIQGATPVAHKVDKNMVVLIDPSDDPDDILRINRSREKQYVFDVTFDGNTTQDEVYQNTSSFLIPNVISGFNATVFAYGATGAGKTHTMLGTEDDPGIMARALNNLFKEMDNTKDDMTYSVSMSYLEIYNEMIRDLLNPSSGYLELREDSKGVQVAGLVEVSAFSTREVMDMLTKGNKERTQEPTAANKTSSRSHAILQVTVKQRNRVRNIMQEVRVGKLFLIDLAGSERAAATHNRGKRMVEGAHINRSLLALGNCINALSDKNGSKYVNYRDSKLTRLLKDALGGNCKTVMIAHISPASIHFEESRNTLVYADRAKHIKTKVRKNVVDVTYHIAQYTNIIAELREEIGRLRLKLDEQSGNKNAAVISAIQSEVMHAPKSENQSEVARVREQLLEVFNIQMELRRSLMEFNNTTIEMTLETSRNQLLVQKWEKEKILRKNRPQEEDTFEGDGENGEKDLQSEKQRDLEGTGSDEVPEPEEVRVARQELQLLQEEKAKTESLKAKVQKELEKAKKRAAQIEETLPRKVGSEEQKEIIHLLCKVHELEIENMEMQSSCLLWNFDSRRKDMIISKQYQHHQLCDEIIAQQRSLLDTHQVACPKDLDELYELYQQETEQRPEQEQTMLPSIDKTGSILTLNRRMLESDSTSDMDKFSALDVDSASLLSARLFPLKKPLLKLSTNNMARLDEGDSNNNKIFSQSPKFREIREAAAKEGLDDMGSRSFIAPLALFKQRQESIITLSSRSDATSPTPAQEKTIITTNTRNIAALAARRKNKAQLNTYNTEKQKDDNYLSASRLANHDRKYGTTSVGIRHLLEGDNYSIGTGDTTVRTQKNGRRGHAGRRNRTRSYEANYQQMTPEIFFRQLNTTTGRRHGDQMSVASMTRGKNTRLPQPNASRTIHNKFLEENDIRELTSVETPPINVHQAAPDKGRGLTVQRKFRGHRNENVGQKTARKPPPSIPSFRKGDMAVTGFALQR